MKNLFLTVSKRMEYFIFRPRRGFFLIIDSLPCSRLLNDNSKLKSDDLFYGNYKKNTIIVSKPWQNDVNEKNHAVAGTHKVV